MSADQPDISSSRRYAVIALKLAGQRRPALAAVLAHRRRPTVGERAPGVGAVDARRDRGLRRQRAGGDVALAAAARRAGRARAARAGCSARCLVALFFNNFLPSNIGGDVIRIRDTARPAGSKTLATTVVLTIACSA